MADAKPKSTPPIDAEQVSEAAAALAAHLQRSGVQWLPKPRPDAVAEFAELMEPPESTSPVAEAAPPAASAERPTSSPPTDVAQQPPRRPEPASPPARLDPVDAFASGGGAYPGADLSPDERQAQLDQLSEQVSVCKRCEILSGCRNKTVFGEGSSTPRFVFFGEGPGADEDRSGRPFVGRAGQLLTKMIEACQFRREDAYIFNTVKCRPPGNRNPEPDEIENCRPYYEQQLAILRPEYIVCLGAVAAQELLNSKLSVGRLRGKLHAHFESKVLVTYHPAYLLRNPAAKKAAWADLQLMLRDAGII